MPFTRSSDHRTLRPRPPPPPPSKPKPPSQKSPSSKSKISSSSSSSTTTAAASPSTPPPSSKKKRKASNISSSSTSLSLSKLKVKSSSSPSSSYTTQPQPQPPPPPPPKKRKTRVIIIGAGISGLSAARELLHRRYDVLVLEARLRPGGRLKTCQMHLSSSSSSSSTKKTAPIDLGGGFIHGINKNPVYDLCKKMGLRTHPFHSSSCLLVNEMGWPIDYEEDRKVSDRFNFVLGESQKICEGGSGGGGGGEEESESFKILWEELEKKKKKDGTKKNVDTTGENEKREKKVKKEQHDGDDRGNNTEQTKSFIKETDHTTTTTPTSSDNDNTKKNPPKQQHRRHLDPNIPFGQIFTTLTNHYASNLSHAEQLLYQWHKANLEMSCGTSLDDLGQNWNEDEQYGFGGKHVVLKNGFSELIAGLEEGLGGTGGDGGGASGGRVKYGMEVKEIKIVNTRKQQREKKKVKEEEEKEEIENNSSHQGVSNDQDKNETEQESNESRKRRSRRAHAKINYAESSLEKNIIHDEEEEKKKKNSKNKNNDSKQEKNIDDNDDDNESSSSQVLVTVQPTMSHTNTKKQEENKSKTITLQADAVIVTLPLGILSLPPTHPQHVHFYPPLPTKKQQAISKLGFGTYNKCALAFSHVFWTQSDFIGYVGSNPGRNILFMNISVIHTHTNATKQPQHHKSTPILIMVYGSNHASDVDDKLKDVDVVRECLDVLRKICGKKDIPQPVDYAVTRWGREKYSRGGFSFVPPGVKGVEEFGVMGQPIYEEEEEEGPLDETDGAEDEKVNEENHHDNDTEKTKVKEEEKEKKKESNVITTAKGEGTQQVKKTNESKSVSHRHHRSPRPRPLILFAGEATTPYHPSTIHGAYLSGIREAYRLDLSLEPALNRYIEFDESFLYRRTFSVKKRKRRAGEDDEEEEDWEDKETKKVVGGGGGGGGGGGHQQQGSGGVRQRKRREVSVLSSSMATSQQKKQSSSRMSMRGKRSRGNDMSFSGQKHRERDNVDGENYRHSPPPSSSSSYLEQQQQQQQGMQKIKGKDGVDPNGEYSSTEQNGQLAQMSKSNESSSFFEDLTILRGADSYGTDKDGWNFVRSRMMPPLLDEESKHLLLLREEGNAIDEGSTTTNKRKKGQKKSSKSGVVKRNKSTEYLSARYQQLMARRNSVNEKEDENQDASAFLDQNEESENMWYLPDGSGTWLAEEKVMKAAAEAFPPDHAAGQKESKRAAVGSGRKKEETKVSNSSNTMTTLSASSLSSLSSRRKSPRKVTPKKRMNI